LFLNSKNDHCGSEGSLTSWERGFMARYSFAPSTPQLRAHHQQDRLARHSVERAVRVLNRHGVAIGAGGEASRPFFCLRGTFRLPRTLHRYEAGLPQRARQMTDEHLMLEVRGGSRPAFEALFERYKDAVWRFYRRRIDDPGRAEELAQDVFVAVLQDARRYEPRAAFRRYLFGIACNHYEQIR
jgi:hypothetical protein